MNNMTENEILMGKVVGYKTGISLFSRNARVIVNAEGARIVISMDNRQIKFIENEFPEGSQIPVEYHSGKWHVGNMPETQDIMRYDTDISALEILDKIGKRVAE